MWTAFWHRRWMMTWGNGLEEHRDIVSWKMSICAWQSFGTSLSTAVSGRDENKSRAGIVALRVSLCYTFGYFFKTVDWITFIMQKVCVCMCEKKTKSQQKFLLGHTRTTNTPNETSNTAVHTSFSLLQCLKVLIIISILPHSCHKDYLLWMIIIIIHSRIAVKLLYHQQHHPTHQGYSKSNLKFIYAIQFTFSAL